MRINSAGENGTHQRLVSQRGGVAHVRGQPHRGMRGCRGRRGYVRHEGLLHRTHGHALSDKAVAKMLGRVGGHVSASSGVLDLVCYISVSMSVSVSRREKS